MAPPKKNDLPEELKGVTKDVIDTLGEKVERCYSKERYEVFQKAVKKITIDTIKHEDGRIPIKIYANEEIDARFYKNIKFWLTIILTPLVTAVVTTVIIKALWK